MYVKPKIDKAQKGWYVYCYPTKEDKEKLKALFLWNDLSWNELTSRSRMSYPGYFSSRKEAREVLDQWYLKVIGV